MKTGRIVSGLLVVLAQSMALLSPVCFYLCTGPDGHAALEFIGQECHRSAMLSHDDESAPNTDHPQIHESCGCQHSPLPANPQLTAVSVAFEVRWSALVLADPASANRSNQELFDREAILLCRSLPPVSAPHLRALSTVVLRV